MQEAEQETQNLFKALTSLDRHITSHTYLAGHALTLADVILCCDLKAALEKVSCPSLLNQLCVHACMRYLHAHGPSNNSFVMLYMQVLGPAARESIPAAVRWFQTLAHQQHFASVLGPVSLAAAGAGAAAGKRPQSASGSKGKAADSNGAVKAAKGGKDKGAAKPKQAPKAAAANGGPAGEPACSMTVHHSCSHHCTAAMRRLMAVSTAFMRPEGGETQSVLPRVPVTMLEARG